MHSFFLIILNSRLYVNLLVHHYLTMRFWFFFFPLCLICCLSYPLVLDLIYLNMLFCFCFFFFFSWIFFEEHLDCGFYSFTNHLQNCKHAYFIILENCSIISTSVEIPILSYLILFNSHGVWFSYVLLVFNFFSPSVPYFFLFTMLSEIHFRSDNGHWVPLKH